MNAEGRKRLKIAIVNDAFFPHLDGVTMVVNNYIHELSKIADVTLFVPHPDKKSDYKQFYEKLPCDVVFCKSSFLKVQRIPIPIPYRDPVFVRALKKSKFDVIHNHSVFSLGEYFAKYAKKHKIFSVTTIHTKFEDDLKRYFKSNFIVSLLLKHLIRIINKHNVVFSINDKMQEYFLARGLKAKKEIVPNGTNFKKPEDFEKLWWNANKKFQIDHKNNNLLFVGRMIEKKGIFFIAKALSELTKLGIKYEMYFIGEGVDLPKLKTELEKSGEIKNCRFLGNVYDQFDLQSVYAASKLFLFPSTYDTDGLVKREAAVCKVPTIFVEDTICSSEIKNNFNGYITKCDAVKYAAKIAEILSNETDRQRVGQNASDSLYLNWEDSVKRAYDLYLKHLA